MTAPTDPNRSPGGADATSEDSWEDVLRRGRDDDAGKEVPGSVDPELAYINLLRHARRPDALTDVELDKVWMDIDGAIAPARVPFWKRAWVRALVPVGGVAAAVLFVVVQSGDQPTVATNAKAEPTVTAELEGAASAGGMGSAAKMDERASAASPAAASAPAPAADAPEEVETEEESAPGGAAVPGPAQILESQFKTLEPAARARVNTSVDGGRGSMRSALLGQALSAGTGSGTGSGTRGQQ